MVARFASDSQEITASGRVGISGSSTYDSGTALDLGRLGLGLEQFQSNRRFGKRISRLGTN